MDCAYFLFHDDLNDFLPRRKRDTTIEHSFDWRASIKDMIESLGVPHCEIEWIIVNGSSVNFTYIVQPDDRVDVYPYFSSVDVTPRLSLRPPLPSPLRFVLDTHLGRLAAYLRMMGFDTLYRNDYPDDELAQISASESRILLTRDIGLLKRGLVTYGYFMRETNPPRQLAEITRRYELLNHITPFKHCMKCNGLLAPVEKDKVVDQLPRDTAQHYNVFHQCQSCERIYWKGPHYQRMSELMDQVIREV
jgi:uncharacterized protein